MSGVGAGIQHADDSITMPIGLEDKNGKRYLSHYKAAVVRDSSLPALLGMDSLTKLNAVTRCRTGEIWFMKDGDCEITPKGDHVHLQMKKGALRPLVLPVGRFSETMATLGHNHLVASSNPVCSQPSSSSNE